MACLRCLTGNTKYMHDPHCSGLPMTNAEAMKKRNERMTASEVTSLRNEHIGVEPEESPSAYECLGRNTLGIGIKGSDVGSASDAVKAPSHYMLFDGIESIEVIARSTTESEFRGFCFGNVLKYRLRAGKKSELATMEQDLKKAAFYQELFDKHKELCYAK